jgi:putative ABC transport system permease protein
LCAAVLIPAAQLHAQQPVHRTIAVDERLAQDAGLSVGDRIVLAAEPDEPGDTVIVGAIVRRGADPSEIARAEPRIRVHLTQLQELIGYGDRVDRFAVAARDDSVAAAVARINAAAFGFRAHRSADIAVETSETFRVVTRFHRAIGVITIVASAIFLLCILLLKVDERRRDIAALRLLGISRRTVVRMIVAEAAMIALIGSALGVAFGYAVSGIVNRYYQALYRTPLEFSIVTGDIVLMAGVLSLLLGIAAGALAAQRLVRTAPLALLGR